MKMILMDTDENEVHEFDDPNMQRIHAETIVHWAPTDKNYIYHDSGQDDSGPWMAFIEAETVSVSPAIGGKDD
jgi:hypothetical protein